MVSFIILNSTVTKVIKRIVTENAGGEFEIIFTDSWEKGIKASSQDFVCLTDKIFMISGKYLKKLLKPFKTNYHKLAIVAPAIGLESWEHKLYGYYVDDDELIPLVQPHSIEPHLIQIAPIIGAVIRRSALKGFKFTNSEINDSVRLSLHLWTVGSRCILNPEATYYSFVWENQDIPEDTISLPQEVEKLFKQELV